MAEESLRLLKGTLDVLILKTLSWGPAHGYAISRWIRDCSAEDLRIEEGALYPALRRLEERGWVESTWKATDAGRDVRVYQLTDRGRRGMKTEVDAWQRYVAAFSRILTTRPRESLS